MSIKKYIWVFLFAISITNTYGQNQLISSDEPESISIKKLHSTSTIFGDLGITTYTVEIFNHSERVLSGELQFPLSDHQTIIGYALDINGVLRSAVAVDKAKGRAAYENIVSRSVDPGLIEKTEGNNFKTRVYPIPANGSRIISLTILDKLIWVDGKMNFTLPVDFKETIAEKEVKIDLVGFSKQVRVSGLDLFDSIKDGENLSLRSKKIKDFHLEITPLKKSFSFYQNKGDHFYYYTTTPFVKHNKITKSPKKITILWDHSRSRKGQVSAEIGFLKKLAVKLQNVKFNLLLFNSELTSHKRIVVRNGNTAKLESFLKAIQYDGATQYSVIDKIPQADLTLLFSDGLSNFGNLNFQNQEGVTIHTISSQTSGNPFHLKAIAATHGGTYTNLQNDPDLSITKLTEEATIFKGFKETELAEYYPKYNTRISKARIKTVIKGDFSDKISPLFNYELEIPPVSIPIKIDTTMVDLERLFAIEKLNDLNLYPKKNKYQIKSLGLQYQLLTDYTSLIVLEEIQDYIKNEIAPPTPALKKLYFANLEIAKLEKERLILDVLWEQRDYLTELLEWRFPEKEDELESLLEEHETNLDISKDSLDFKIDSLETLLDNQKALFNLNPTPLTVDANHEEPEVGNASIEINATLEGDHYLVSGTIKDDSQFGFPGVNVISSSGNLGTVTDFEGNFSIQLPLNTILKFSFIGFQMVEQTITPGTHTLDMPIDDVSLEEVIVVGHSSQTPSTYKNKKDFLENAPNVDEYQVFNYKEQVIIKKKNSHVALGKSPLVFVDYDAQDFQTLDWENGAEELKYLDWKEVFSLEIIPQKAAMSLAGEIAKDGIIFVYTTYYVEDDPISIPIKYNKHVVHELSKKVWQDIPQSLLDIKKFKPKKRYDEYLKLVASSEQPVGFYMAAGSIFKDDDPVSAVKIWSNIAEIQLDNHENMRTLAYLLRSIEHYKEAIPIFEKIIELRPDEPIAYRDLAVTYGLNKNYAAALKVLKEALAGNWIERNRDPEDYVEVLNTLYNDFHAIAFKENNHYKEEYIVTSDLRVVLNWTSSDTDIDLHLITPTGDDFYYSNYESDNVRYNTDITQGFGPEEIIVKNAEKGIYKVLVDFYADRQQTIHGPVGVSIEIYKYFGTDKEERIEKVLTLTEEKDDLLGAIIEF